MFGLNIHLLINLLLQVEFLTKLCISNRIHFVDMSVKNQLLKKKSSFTRNIVFIKSALDVCKVLMVQISCVVWLATTNPHLGFYNLTLHKWIGNHQQPCGFLRPCVYSNLKKRTIHYLYQ